MITICAYCRKVRPIHVTNCVYVGAVQYSDATGGQEPKAPYIAVPWDISVPPRDGEKEVDREIRAIREWVSTDDVALVLNLRKIRPEQLQLGQTKRIVES